MLVAGMRTGQLHFNDNVNAVLVERVVSRQAKKAFKGIRTYGAQSRIGYIPAGETSSGCLQKYLGIQASDLQDYSIAE